VLLEQAIETLTVSFQLISTRPALSRDLNALLPTFFGALLDLLKQEGLQPAVFKSWHTLIPDHGTTLRSYSNKLNGTPKSQHLSATTESIELYAKTVIDHHHSAQKGSSGSDWTFSLSNRLSSIQMFLTSIFEPIHEGTTSGFLIIYVDDTRSYPRATPGGEYSEKYISDAGMLQMSLIIITEFLRFAREK